MSEPKRAWTPRPAQPYQPGNQAAVTHGARASVPADEVRAAIVHLFGEEVDDWPLAARRTAEIAGELQVRCERARADLAKRGLVVDGKDNPLLKWLNAWEGRLLAILREHGGTPMTELELTRRRLELRDHAFNAQALEALAADGRAAIQARVVEALPAAGEPEKPTQGPLVADDIEGEPYEDSYLPGVADYDRFNRPSWGVEE